MMLQVLASNNPVDNYLFKASNRNTRKYQWCGSGVFIVSFEHISHIFVVFQLLHLNK